MEHKTQIGSLILLIGLSIAAVIMLRHADGLSLSPKGLIDALPPNVDMQISGIDYTEMKQDRREWTLKADQMRYSKSEGIMVFQGVKATFYSQKGPMHIHGDNGFYDEKDQRIKLVGRVSAEDTEGNRLTTDELWYHVNTRQVFAPGAFQIEGPRMNMTGRDLSFDTESRKLLVSGRPELLIKQLDGAL